MTAVTQEIPRGFVRRTTSSVLLIFMATMVVFLWAAFRSERNFHYRETFEHLEETSAVLALLPELRIPAASTEVAALETRLAERTGTAHQVIVMDPESRIVVSSDSSRLGQDAGASLGLVPYGPSGSGRAIAKDGTGHWLASSTLLEEGGGRIFLMRSRQGSEDFVSGFWGVHGLHVGVTVLLFFLLLRFLGERYVRRPIVQLAAHVQRVEAGEFLTRPERYEEDEFGWLAARFSRMGLRLKEAVERLVRTEKYAAASAVAYVVATEAMEPLNSLKRHIAYLEGLAAGDGDLRSVADSLEKDRRELAQAVVRLEKLGPAPEDLQTASVAGFGDGEGAVGG